MKLTTAGVVIYIIFLLVWGSLLITSTAYAFQFTNEFKDTLTDEQRKKYHWTRFGAVIIGITGAAMIVRAIVMAVVAGQAGGKGVDMGYGI